MSEEMTSGILKLTQKGGGVLYDPSRSFYRGEEAIKVSAHLVRQLRLTEGATLAGPARDSGQGLELIAVESVCGLSLQEFQDRTPYNHLTAIDPCHRFDLAASGDTSMRVVDMVAPIGRGTRGLIVSPPKAGKTILLEKLAQAMYRDDPRVRIIVL